MRILLDVMTTGPKRQDSTVWRNFQVLFLVYVLFAKTHADVLDAMSRQFFGLQTDDQQRERHYQKGDDFSQMFGGNQENRTPHRSGRPHQHERNRPPHHSKSNHHRQGYYPPSNTYYSHHPNLQPQHYPPQPIYIHPHGHPQAHPQVHPQTHPQMMQKTNESSNGTQSTDVRHPHHYGVHFAPAAHPHAYPPPTSVEYHTPPETIVEYHHPPHHHHPPIEEHHYPEVHEYHHPPPHKPKNFQISFKQPSPDLKIIDQHVKLPHVKLRLHINPKILITTNTKDPLEKDKHHDHHDIEPYPPPDAFSDHNAPPSYNKHEVRHYPVEHHYTAVEEHHYPPPLALHDPPLALHDPHLPHHHAHLPQHHAHLPPVVHDYGTATYDLSHHHGYINPHRSSGHYEPSFKIKMNPIIFTEPPPTRGTTTTTTRRPTTTTTTTTTSTTTRRPRSRSRARQNARSPGFSLAFTEGSTASSNVNSVTTSLSSTETSITRRSVFSSSGREREQNNATIETRKDTEVTEESTIKPTSTSKATSTTQITTTSTTATPRTTLTSSTVQLLTTMPTKPTTISTTPKPTTTTATTPKPTTTTATTPKPTTTTATTPKPTTTTATTSKPSSTTTATTTSTVKSTTEKTTTTERVTSTTTKPTTRRIPAEATTQRRRVFNDGANEIDMTKPTEASRNLEPLLEEAETTLQNSENVKIIETTMMIDGKNQTVRFYYIMQPVKLPPEIFHQMIGQKGKSGLKMLKISD